MLSGCNQQSMPLLLSYQIFHHLPLESRGAKYIYASKEASHCFAVERRFVTNRSMFEQHGPTPKEFCASGLAIIQVEGGARILIRKQWRQ